MKGFIEAAMMVLIVLAGGCSVLFTVKGIIPGLVQGQTDGWLILFLFFPLWGPAALAEWRGLLAA